MKKLLIVDDDVPLLDSLRFVFRGLYEVRTARSAEEASTLLEQQETEVMLLDIHLPGVNGIEFLRTVRERFPHLPVILVSAASTIRPMIKALELGEADYIRKPFDIDELRLVVARALHQSDLRRRVAGLEEELARRPFVAETGGRPMKEALEAYERTLIQQALQRAGGVQTQAAQLLGTTRRILRYRMEKLEISAGES
jgi:two-component system NtrC family response regulator